MDNLGDNIFDTDLGKTYEDALLGFILTDPDKMHEVADILPSPDYFSYPTNKAAYSVFLKLFAADRFPGDPTLMVEELYTGGPKSHFETKDAAARYIAAIMESSIDTTHFSPSHFEEYAHHIKWEKDKRDLRNIITETMSQVDKIPFDERSEFLGSIENQLSGISMNVHGKQGLQHISEMTGDIADQIKSLHSGDALPVGIQTGIDVLDATLNGLKGGEVCVLAARPAKGKTTLSMQIAYNVAKTEPAAIKDKDTGEIIKSPRNAVLIFSLEMMADQLVSRMIATIGRVNMQQFMEEYQKYISGYYKDTYGAAFNDKMQQKLQQQYERTQIALKEIAELPIYPTTESNLSPNAIKSMVMQKKREIEKKGEKLGLIVIDYLQLMVPSTGKSNASRTEEVGDMSRKMKLLAKDFDVPVLLLAQLNRNADETERPNLKDLRESGSIEQDADKVMFIWAENADLGLNDFTDFREESAKKEALRREQMKVTISVAKNRQGETGDCRVVFDKGFQTFVSQSDEYSASGETYEEFAMKYYQKTRTDDIFWPLRVGEISQEFEKYRSPKYREQAYLTNDGRVLTLSDDDSNSGAKMNVVTVGTQQIDVQKQEVDDMTSDFEVLDDEKEQNIVEHAVNEQDNTSSGESNIVMDNAENDEDIDMTELDMLDSIKL